MNIIFIEDCPKHIPKFHDCRIIALTPLAMYNLDKMNVEYKIPEDYYIWNKKRIDLANIKNWLTGFSKHISNYYWVDDFNISHHFAAMLIGVLEPFIRKIKQFEEIIEQENPKRVLYFVKDNDNAIDDELYFKGQSLFNLFAQNYIDTRFIYVDGKEKKVSNWKDNKYIRNIYDWFRYKMFLNNMGKSDYLFASYMNGVKSFNNKRISCDVVRRLPKELLIIMPYIPSNFNNKIFNEINSIFNLKYDCKKILEDRFRYFIKWILSQVFSYRDYFIGYLIKKDYKAVIFNRRNKLYQYGLLLAARKLNIPTIYVKHGWEGYKNTYDDIRRLALYDYFVVHNKLDKEFYTNMVKKQNLNCEII